MSLSRRALVVDDNRLNSRLVEIFLARLGWQAVVVDSGAQALAQLRDQSFDLVILDLRMPQMSGEQVCRAIRDDLGLSRLPVVAYTAHAFDSEQRRILAAGFDDLLTKPITKERLLAVIEAR